MAMVSLIASSGLIVAAAQVSGATWDATLKSITAGNLAEVKKHVTSHDLASQDHVFEIKQEIEFTFDAICTHRALSQLAR